MLFSALSLSGIGLEQVDKDVTYTSVKSVIANRFDSYCAALGHSRPSPTFNLRLALGTARLRTYVEDAYYRYSIINGRIWYRTEGLIPQGIVGPARLPESLCLSTARCDESAQLEHIRTLLKRDLANNHSTEQVIDKFLQGVVEDPFLEVHHATLTCVRGVMLECPHMLSDSDHFYTRTAFHSELDLNSMSERLGHSSLERLTATLHARMIKLKRKAVTNYYGEGQFSGEWIEKAADYMIFFDEDTHYRGHKTVGLATGGRAAFEIKYQKADKLIKLPPMMGDLRVVRIDTDADNQFTVEQLIRVIEYAKMLQHIIEFTFKEKGVVGLASGVAHVDL